MRPKKYDRTFYEIQRFSQIWYVLLMVGSNVFLITGCVRQLIFKNPWGNNPMNDGMLLFVTIVAILITVWLSLMKLNLFIDKEGISVHFFLLQLRPSYYPWEAIDSCDVVKYNPLREFGGWGVRIAGIRIGPAKRAYTISGNYALKLKLANKSTLFIGTKRPEELKEFLNQLHAEREQK